MMASHSPSNYSKELPRVSEVVGEFFPFTNEKRSRYEGWLRGLGIKEGDYLEESQKVGTWVHENIEKAIKTGRVTKAKSRKAELVRQAIKFIKDHGLTPVSTELYVKTKWYQGTCDLVALDGDGKLVVVDWKTWGAARWRWKLDYSWKKPKDKLDKVRFQLSLYSYPTKAKYAYAVELRDDGYRAYHMEVMTRKSIKSLMEEYGKTFVRQD